MSLSSTLLFAGTHIFYGYAGLMIEAPDEVDPYTVCRVIVKGVDDKASVLFRANGPGKVSRGTGSKGVLEFVAPPGLYHIEALIIKVEDERVVVHELFHDLRIKEPKSPDKPEVKPMPKPQATVEDKVRSSTTKIKMGRSHCSCGITNLNTAQGMRIVVTAAHCFSAGQTPEILIQDEWKPSRVVYRSADDDLMILLADVPEEIAGLPIPLAPPENKTEVLHFGHGVHYPGNKETGFYYPGSGFINKDVFSLNVSLGDSGAPLCASSDGSILSVCCCAEDKNQYSRVFGCKTKRLIEEVNRIVEKHGK